MPPDSRPLLRRPEPGGRCERCGSDGASARYGGVILLCDGCDLEARVPEIKALKGRIERLEEGLELAGQRFREYRDYEGIGEVEFALDRQIGGQ